MLDFLTDNIFVMFRGLVSQQTVGIPMGTNCAPVLTDSFPYSYDADFILTSFREKRRKMDHSFGFTFRSIGMTLTRKLLNHELVKERFNSSLRKFFGHRHDYVEQITNDNGYLPIGVTTKPFL